MALLHHRNGRPRRRQNYLMQRRVNWRIDQYRPHRWNWHELVRPLDETLARQSDQPMPHERVRSLRYFWLDGLFASISENFYVGFVTLFALAYGATNGQVGLLAAVANLLGALSLFPGAHLGENPSRRKTVVIWSGGGLGRVLLLLLALVPLLFRRPELAIVAIIALNGLRSFMSSLSNPGWTAMVADLVPDTMRGRFFGSRNMAMGMAALLVAPLAGRLINLLNNGQEGAYLGYQMVFLLAFAFGMVSTVAFRRIEDVAAPPSAAGTEGRGGLAAILQENRAFLGLVASAFIWNMALQVAAPFFNVYLVNSLGATTAMVGLVASVSSLFALFGQQVFGRLLDRKGALWVQVVSGLLIPGLPFAWMVITEPWHVGIINVFGGFLWAGYNLSNFNLLLQLTPDEQRPTAVALFQTAVFSSSVVGPLLGGYLADTFSYQLVFGLSGIGRLVGMALFLLLTVRALRARTARSDEQQESRPATKRMQSCNG